MRDSVPRTPRPASASRSTSRWSANSSRRAAGSRPKAGNEEGVPPAAMPSCTRPPDRASATAASSAGRGGGRGSGQQHEGGGRAALVLAEVVLGHPGGGEAELLGVADLLEGEAVALGGRGLLQEAGEQSQAGAGHDAGISS